MQFISETSIVADGNMSFKYSERTTVLENRRRFLEKLDLSPEQSVMMDSDHEDKVTIIYDSDLSDLKVSSAVDADTLITQSSDLTLLLLTGDCLPIAFHDQTTGTIGLMHLSRHTFCLDLIEKTFAVLRNVLQIDPQNLTVHIAPHIQKASYCFPLPLHEEPQKLAPYIEQSSTEACVDLTKAAVDQFIAAGVASKNISVSPVDTFADQNYFSHVRSAKVGEPEGRIMTAVCLKT